MAESADTSSHGRRSGSRREREFRRYAESVVGIRAAESGRAAASSTDVSLTAFAQLVALRLNAKRVLVSLFDNSFQYILAEATPTLSLQRDTEHEDGDAIFFGSTVLPRTNDWATETIKLARKYRSRDGSDGEDAALCIPDLLADPRYANHPHVTGEPSIRSYIGVPLMTPHGYAIGTLAVLDNKSRPQGVTRTEMRFLRDVAASIMSHLELARMQMTHSRGVRMVRGLSRFMEGKDTIFDDGDSHSESHSRAHPRPGLFPRGQHGSARTNALESASNAERMMDAREALHDRFMSQTPRNPSRNSRVPDGMEDARRPSQSSIEASNSDATETGPVSNHVQYPSPNQLQEAAISGDIGEAFQRAASLVQQAMDMAGVLFLDASAGQFGSLRSAQHDGGSSQSSRDSYRAGSNTTRYCGSEHATPGESTSQAVPSRLKACRYLGAAYQAKEDGTTGATHHEIPEKFLSSLQRRYPHGKIFNYNEDGVMPSSDEHSESSESAVPSVGASPRPQDPEATAMRKRVAQSDSNKLLSLFPGVRSFAIMPMYDSQRARHLAGAMVWSYNPARFFTFQDDLNYLGAFCDVLMAEVGRLDYQAEVRSKTNFIASISHELRSPLHGILGGVEFLQDDAYDNDPGSRMQMVQMIDTCGRSLLDIINNLLEHAHADKRKRGPRSRHPRGPSSTTSSEPVHDLAILAEEVLDSALWHTPQPAARSRPDDKLVQQSAEALKVILDLDVANLPTSGWNFHINAGAFRRILQNITNNAIKYTDNGGYFKLTIKTSKGPQRGRTSMIEIECTDSGRGMTQEYLNTGLWGAFRQEDPHATGTGLGLSLVRILVEDMNGSIDVRSTKDVGTSIVIRLPLTPGGDSGSGLLESSDAAPVQGLTFALVGFESAPDQLARSSEATQFLRTSVENMCQYLGLKPTGSDQLSAVSIVTERRAIAAAQSQTGPREAFQSRPCVVLCDSISSSRATLSLLVKSSSLSQATMMPQPVGPRKLLKAFTLCLNKHATTLDRHIAVLDPRQEVLPHVAMTPIPPIPAAFLTSADVEMLDVGVLVTGSQASGRSLSDTTRPPMSCAFSSVLLVDDNSVNLTILQRYMIRLGRQQCRAMNGLEALEAYHASHSQHLSATPVESPVSPASDSRQPPTATSPISIIFMDITMPVMDGLEATRQIRALERALGLKPAMIVALTALASPRARQEAYSSGVDLFLTKPVRFADIQQMFRDWEVDLVE